MNLGQAIGSAVRDSIREEVRPPTGIWNAIGRTTYTTVRDWIYEQDAIRYEVWLTADDERTCPTCAPMDGVIWQEGEGFHPPLHDHCRCTRGLHHVEWRTRAIEVWRDVAVHQTDWVWQTT